VKTRKGTEPYKRAHTNARSGSDAPGRAQSRQYKIRFAVKLPARFPRGTASTAAARTPAAASAASPKAPAPATTAAESTTRAGFARTRFIYGQRSSAKVGTIQCRHRFIRIRVDRHFDECKSARLTGFAVLYNLNSVHLPVLREGGVQILFSCLERNVPDIDIFQNKTPWMCCPRGQVRLQRLNSAGRLTKAGKVAVGGIRQPLEKILPPFATPERESAFA
jgi:hypothetical protein